MKQLIYVVLGYFLLKQFKTGMSAKYNKDVKDENSSENENLVEKGVKVVGEAVSFFVNLFKKNENDKKDIEKNENYRDESGDLRL